MLLMVGSVLRLFWIHGTSTMEKGQADGCVPGVCQGADKISALLLRCAGRCLGQDTSWLDSPINDGGLPWIKGAKWLCKSIHTIYRSEPIQHNCLEIDNILLSCSIAAALLTRGFRHNYLPLEHSITPTLVS